MGESLLEVIFSAITTVMLLNWGFSYPLAKLVSMSSIAPGVLLIFRPFRWDIPRSQHRPLLPAIMRSMDFSGADEHDVCKVPIWDESSAWTPSPVAVASVSSTFRGQTVTKGEMSRVHNRLFRAQSYDEAFHQSLARSVSKCCSVR